MRPVCSAAKKDIDRPTTPHNKSLAAKLLSRAPHSLIQVRKTSLALLITSILAPGAWAQYAESVLHTFHGSDGSQPTASLIFDAKGNLYGTTSGGGPNSSGNCETASPDDCGEVFELSPPGSGSGPWAETLLHGFCETVVGSVCIDGEYPSASLVFDSHGNLYGTTVNGGANNQGVVFELSPPGSGSSPWTETVLYSFCSVGEGSCTDGRNPNGSLIFDPQGNLYGTTISGGDCAVNLAGCGVIFELSSSSGGSGPWTESVLYSFTGGSDGGGPGYVEGGGLIFDSHGNLYGMTNYGGDTSSCVQSSAFSGCGVVFELSPPSGGSGPWTESVLHAFTGPFAGGADGAFPGANLALDANGNLYGTTLNGGGSGDGIVFEVSPPSGGSGPWTETVLYAFTGLTDGGNPYATPIFDPHGNLYGTASAGGNSGGGVAFELSPPSGGSGPWIQNVLYSFTGDSTGLSPFAGLIFDSKGNLYGTTYAVDPNQDGTVFELEPLISTTTALASSPNPSTGGQIVTFSATVAASSGGTPKGTVTFYNGSSSIGSATLVGGVATLKYGSLTAGTHSITATYNGSSTDALSVSEPVPQVVNLDTTTTSLATSPNPSTSGQSVTMTATVTPGNGVAATGTVSFYSGSTLLGNAALSGGVATLNHAFTTGTYSLSAKYTGSNYKSPSTSNTVSQAVGNFAATTTSLASGQNPSTAGQSVTFTATVSGGSSPTGTVGFTANGMTISGCSAAALSSTSGTAQCATSALATGTDSIVATYSGDSKNSGSTSSALSQVVNKAATTTALASSVNPSTVGQSVTFTATVSGGTSPTGPTGTVAFTSNGASITGCSSVTLASASAQCATSALPVGTDAIEATYSGDSNNSGSSGNLSQTVTKANTTTAVASNVNPSTVGQSVTFTATVSGGVSPAGTVAFTANSTTISGCSAVTVTSGQAACTTSFSTAATYSIVATYSGDSNNSGSASAALSQVVQSATVTTTTVLSSSLNPSTGGQTVTFTAMVSASSGGTPTGTVTFYNGSASIGTVTLAAGVARLNYAALVAGTHSITATYNGSGADPSSTSAVVSQVVNLDTTTTSLSTSPNPSTSGSSVSMTATVTPGNGVAATGTVSFYSGSTLLGNASLSGGVATLKHTFTTGTYSLTAKYTGSNYKSPSTSSVVTQTVN